MDRAPEWVQGRWSFDALMSRVCHRQQKRRRRRKESESERACARGEVLGEVAGWVGAVFGPDLVILLPLAVVSVSALVAAARLAAPAALVKDAVSASVLTSSLACPSFSAASAVSSSSTGRPSASLAPLDSSVPARRPRRMLLSSFEMSAFETTDVSIDAVVRGRGEVHLLFSSFDGFVGGR